MSARFSRRNLLLSSAALVSLSSPGQARTIRGEMPWSPGEADAPRAAPVGGYQFFTSAEVTFMDAIVARLIPADDLGPGAKEAGVTVFLDRQLAGPYGR